MNAKSRINNQISDKTVPGCIKFAFNIGPAFPIKDDAQTPYVRG